MMKFRKLDLQTRRQQLETEYGDIDTLTTPEIEWVDCCIENAIGVMAIPLGLATGFVIDGRELRIPMATEEPSVIAAASFAATVIGRAGGFATDTTDPVMACQVVLEDPGRDLAGRLQPLMLEIEVLIRETLVSMEKRGGGLRNISVEPVEAMAALQLRIEVDVRDALGANRLNTCAEVAGCFIQEKLKASVLLAIVCNDAEDRRATATCTLTDDHVAALCKQRYPADECVRRVVLAGQLARHDRRRAVTHNKGIMNGITALALATGNDTRALEAAVHAWAARDGTYRGLSRFEATEQGLHCHLELPLPLATIGGMVSSHPTSRFALKVLSDPDGPGLTRIAAALGLAQNIAAVCALVSTGIQAGHMPLHIRKERMPDA